MGLRPGRVLIGLVTGEVLIGLVRIGLLPGKVLIGLLLMGEVRIGERVEGAVLIGLRPTMGLRLDEEPCEGNVRLREEELFELLEPRLNMLPFEEEERLEDLDDEERLNELRDEEELREENPLDRDEDDRLKPPAETRSTVTRLTITTAIKASFENFMAWVPYCGG